MSQSSPHPSTQNLTGTEIRARMLSSGEYIVPPVAKQWAADIMRKFAELSALRSLQPRGQMPSNGPWEPTPRWLFWRPTMRRKTWRLDGDVWLPCYDHQHPAFVAREALENYCAPRPSPGEGCSASQGRNTDSDRPSRRGVPRAGTMRSSRF